MECKRCLMTAELAHIHEDGECDFCKMHDKLQSSDQFEFYDILEKIRKRKGYQVLIGISGGLDSSFLLWFTVKKLELKPLVLHFNNKWNTTEAEHNMSLLVEHLGVDLIRITSDDEYDELCGAMLFSGTKDLDIANDMYMADLMQTVARKYKIKYIFNGHDFRYEGSTPITWTYMDAKYIRSVYEWAYGKKLKAPVQTFWKQIVAGLLGVKHIRPFNYFNIPFEDKMKVLRELGVRDYGPKHGENIYTKFIGYYVLPLRFGIDKRIVYLSAQMRTGYITREQALDKLKDGVEVDKSVFPEIESRTGVPINLAMNQKFRTYEDFDHYNFRRWRLVIWLLWKFKLTSYQFYKKYAC